MRRQVPACPSSFPAAWMETRIWWPVCPWYSLALANFHCRQSAPLVPRTSWPDRGRGLAASWAKDVSSSLVDICCPHPIPCLGPRLLAGSASLTTEPQRAASANGQGPGRGPAPTFPFICLAQSCFSLCAAAARTPSPSARRLQRRGSPAAGSSSRAIIPLVLPSLLFFHTPSLLQLTLSSSPIHIHSLFIYRTSLAKSASHPLRIPAEPGFSPFILQPNHALTNTICRGPQT